MWEAITYVSTGVTLAAFLAAVGAWLLKAKADERERLIRTAHPDHRADLVRNALEFFHVETRGLTREQQYSIAIEQIHARAQRFKLLAGLVCVLAVVAAGVGLYSIGNRQPLGPTSFYPQWGPDNFVGVPPRNPKGWQERQVSVRAINDSCGRCIIVSDRTNVIADYSNNPGFRLQQLAPNSYFEFDARQCSTGVRYQLATQELRVIQGAPPGVGSKFAVLDVTKGAHLRVELGGMHGFTYEAVQCLS